MKAELEGQHIQTACWGHHVSQHRGVLLVAETQEERDTLDSLWLDGIVVVMCARADDGSLHIVVAPPGREGEAR